MPVPSQTPGRVINNSLWSYGTAHERLFTFAGGQVFINSQRFNAALEDAMGLQCYTCPS
jgi:hypothetical protein